MNKTLTEAMNLASSLNGPSMALHSSMAFLGTDNSFMAPCHHLKCSVTRISSGTSVGFITSLQWFLKNSSGIMKAEKNIDILLPISRAMPTSTTGSAKSDEPRTLSFLRRMIHMLMDFLRILSTCVI